MKVVYIGDIHGRKDWKTVVNTEKADHYVFVGDYFDSFDKTLEEQLSNFLDIIQFKKDYMDMVSLLIGNHDHHYFPEIGYTGTSGYQHQYHTSIEVVINEHKSLLQACYHNDNILVTHAGVSEIWLSNTSKKLDLEMPELTPEAICEFINMVMRHRLDMFEFTTDRMSDFTGNSPAQTPIWIRPDALIKSSSTINTLGIIQVVGHTRSAEINPSPGYYIIDKLMGTNPKYLIYDNGTILVKELSN